MNDVLMLALERQRELRGELAEIDQFISVAASLLRNARQKSEPRPDRSEIPDRPERTEHAESPSRTERAERPQVVEIPDAAPGPVVRTFPWPNAQPPVRKTGADGESGPTRRNLMRREVS